MPTEVTLSAGRLAALDPAEADTARLAASGEALKKDALVPSGESYFVIRLSSSRDIYLDYRDIFVRFLRSFKALGASVRK